jgi:ribosomal protein L11 methyltransferase
MIFRFKLKPGLSPEAIDFPFPILFTSESPEGNEIVATVPFVEEIVPFSLEIDWEKQWKESGAHFQDGFIHIQTTPPLELIPGPGFGDSSHPTTRLMLSLMEPLVKGETVVDIGCGSGVLSLAAARMGATSVLGIDIDKEAIVHAKKNCTHNLLDSVCRFEMAGAKIDQSVGLMNMITSEQKVAWTAAPTLKVLVTSGVKKEEEKNYITWIESFGFKLQGVKEDQGWLGFVFMIESL